MALDGFTATKDGDATGGMMMRRALLLVWGGVLFGKELLDPNILRDIILKSPYYQQAVVETQIARTNVGIAQGAFDTDLVAKLERKEYPLSTSSYREFGMRRTIEEGVDLTILYRRAQGTQEYNNIKTSKDGEYLVGIGFSPLELIKGINTKRFELTLARLGLDLKRAQSRGALLRLYKEVLETYYKSLFYRASLRNAKLALRKALEAETFVLRQIALGRLARITSVEAKKMVLDREKEIVETNQRLKQQLNRLATYLGMGIQDLQERYTLPVLQDSFGTIPTMQEAFQKAKKRRWEFRFFRALQKEQNLKRRFNELLAYPKTRISLYGVHDRRYGDGAKGSFELTFPMQRRLYRAKEEKNKMERMGLVARMEIFERELRRNIGDLLERLKSNERLMAIERQRVALAKRMEAAEERRFRSGLGTLVELNRRQMELVDAKRSLLHRKLEGLLTYLELRLTMGDLGLW